MLYSIHLFTPDGWFIMDHSPYDLDWANDMVRQLQHHGLFAIVISR